MALTHVKEGQLQKGSTDTYHVILAPMIEAVGAVVDGKRESVVCILRIIRADDPFKGGFAVEVSHGGYPWEHLANPASGIITTASPRHGQTIVKSLSKVGTKAVPLRVEASFYSTWEG